LFKGRGVAKNPTKAAAFLQSAANKGNPVAQNRLARAFMGGVGLPVDKIEAAKWHLLARDAGVIDFNLDLFMSGLSPDERTEAEKSAQAWIRNQ